MELLDKQRMLVGSAPRVGGGVPAAWDQHVPAGLQAGAWHGSSSLFPLFSNFKCRTFFRANSTEVKIQLSPVHVDHNEGFGASVHTPAPSKVQGCLELDPSLLMEVTGIHPSASLCLRRWLWSISARGFLALLLTSG